jgi:hypothetical protein
LIRFQAHIINELNVIFNVVLHVSGSSRALLRRPRLKKTSDTAGTWTGMRPLIRAVTQTTKQRFAVVFRKGCAIFRL